MKRYSYKIIVAGIKEDIQGICNWLEKDDEYCKDLRESVKTYESKFQVLAAWLYARDIEPEEYILSLQKYINSKKLDPSKIKVSKNAIQINDDKFEDKHIFLGSYKEQWRQIGNAVPPLLAYRIANEIKKQYFK
jgi:hypothetical protein